MAMQNVFTGKTGSITLSATDTQGVSPEADDAASVLTSAFGSVAPQVGRATGIQVAVQTDLDEFHEIGHRHPIVLHPGNIHISGSIDRAYLSGALILLLLGQRAQDGKQPLTYPQPAFQIKFDLNDPAVPKNKAELVLDGVKFQNWGVKMPEDDFVMENVTFRALAISVVDTDGGTQIKPKFPAVS
ncbi:hypothetical protein SAMN05519104_4014 [Rhizobiales bacterium GAS188]|nr:hypothetical protein SAMN05519104_4014 [Rhizobiales bacterium GAS188]